MRRIATLVVTLMLLAAFACMGLAEGPTEGYTLPLVSPDEEVTITCWGFPLTEWKVDDLYNNQFTQWLYEQTGVKIEWVMGPAADRDEKLNALIASGDYPEVIFNAPFDASQQQVYGSLGLIIPLNDLIEEYGVETKRIFAEVPDIEKALVRENGTIYCLSTYMDSPHDQSYSRLWFYQPWLDAVGKEAPTTIDELYDVLVAFRDEDPNGNGIQDEIPLVGANVMFSEPFTYLVNSFIYLDNNNMMNVKDGEIIPVYAQEEYREALRFIKKLYDEGLIMPQTFTQNEQSLRQLLATDPMTVGAFFCHAPFVYCDEPVYRDLVAVTPMEGPEGIQYAAQYYVTNTTGTVITDKCKNPEIAFKLIDFLYSAEASKSKNSGPRGVTWDFNYDETLVNDYGVVASWIKLSDDQEPNDRWSMLGNYYQPVEMTGIGMYDMSPKAVAERENPTGKVDGNVQMQRGAMEKYLPFFPPQEIRLPQVFIFTEDEALELADKQLAVNNKVWSMRAEFVIGNADIEADWDQYVQDLVDLGMDDVLAIYQRAYDAMYK